jgi:predicted ester cyclase
MHKFGKIVIYLLLVIAFIVLMGFMAEGESKTAVTEENKAIIGRLSELWNTGNLAIADEIFDADFVNHDPNNPGVTNSESYKGYVPVVRIGFPDFHVATDDLVAEGEKVAFRWTIIATHQGELMGMPATGIQVVWVGMTVAHLVDGKVVEMWWAHDTLGMLQQLGVIPPMGREDFTWGTPSEVTGAPGDPEANKAIIGRCPELWNTGNLAIADEIFGADFVNHDPDNPEITNLESYKGYVSAIRTGFPDFHVATEDLIAEGDKVAIRWIVTATHQGELMGIQATGKEATWTGMTIWRFADGKMVEGWWSKDMLGLLIQLGVIPPPG